MQKLYDRMKCSLFNSFEEDCEKDFFGNVNDTVTQPTDRYTATKEYWR